MTGQDKLQRHIGHKLLDGLIQSFYLKGELSDLINVTFLKFDNEWLRIVSSDESTTIEVECDDIENVKFYGDVEFQYPIRQIELVFPEFKKYLDKNLLGFKELVLKDSNTMSFGLNLYFEDDVNFINKNHDYPIDKNEYYFEQFYFEDIIEI